MSRNKKFREFTESQKVAIRLLKEKINLVNKELAFLRDEWAFLLSSIGKEMNLPENELNKWHLNKEKTGFEYKEPDEKTSK